jgi:NTE family protein
MPPVYDNGSLFVDGGLLNNAPSDVLSRGGANKTILVDVSATASHAEDKYAEAFGRIPQGHAPGLGLFIKQKLRRASMWPSMAETLMNSLLVGSGKSAKENSRNADMYVKLPVESITMLEFKSLETLVDIGYRATLEHAESWELLT